MDRSYHLKLAASGLRMPIVTHLSVPGSEATIKAKVEAFLAD